MERTSTVIGSLHFVIASHRDVDAGVFYSSAKKAVSCCFNTGRSSYP